MCAFFMIRFVEWPARTVLFYYIHMYGTLADPKPAGGLPNGGPVFNNIGGQLAGALLYVSLQDPTLPIPICSMYMRKRVGTCGKKVAGAFSSALYGGRLQDLHS